MTELASQIPVYERLLETGVITRDQVRTAQEKQWREGGEIEDNLVALGYLTEEEMLAFLCDTYHNRYLKLEDIEIEREAIHHIPAALAHAHSLLPIRRTSNGLAIAFADPLNREAMMALKQVTDLEIIPFIASREAIERALYMHYGHPPSPGKTGAVMLEPPRFLLRRHHQLWDDRRQQVGRGIPLEKDRTFDTFVRDGPNELALSVARMIAEGRREESANPFVCFGETGCGKTHLLMAVANWVTAHAPERRFLYTTGRRFSTEYLEALKEDRLRPFRYFYRTLDLLFVDDLEDLFERPWAQDELCETYRALAQSGKWLVAACRTDPRPAPGLLPKLKIAMEEGLVAGIGPYSLEAKTEILARRKGGIPVPPEVFAYLVTRADGTVARLLDILEQVVALSITGHKEIKPELVDEVLRIMGLSESPGREDFEKALSEGTVEDNIYLEERYE
jgi:DNA replication protein DnaC